MRIDWCEWGAAAFASARAESKPVLLSVATTWSRGCREMERTSFADRRVVELVCERFVPVRVDADARPDVAERYAPDGVPATALLTGDGDVIGGGTYVPPDRLAAALARLAEKYVGLATPQASVGNTAGAAPARGAGVDLRGAAALRQSVFAAFDAQYGGFGDEPKFPLVAPVYLAVHEWLLHRADDMRSVAERSLDAMAAGLHDDVEGGFFRMAARRDWNEPQVEKLLSVNAQLLHLYADAAALLETPRYKHVVAATRRYVRSCLEASPAGWAASQANDEEYFACDSADARAELRAPAVDRTIYVNANGAMISAMLRAAEVLDSPDTGGAAVAALEHVLALSYRPGDGVGHELRTKGAVRGLLSDQLAMASAALDAAEATGRVPYAMVAEELARFALRTMWDDAHGGFFDRTVLPPDERIGLLRRPLKPFAENCEAVMLLSRLARESGGADLAERAREALVALAPMAELQGPAAAHYLLALGATTSL